MRREARTWPPCGPYICVGSRLVYTYHWKMARQFRCIPYICACVFKLTPFLCVNRVEDLLHHPVLLCQPASLYVTKQLNSAREGAGVRGSDTDHKAERKIASCPPQTGKAAYATSTPTHRARTECRHVAAVGTRTSYYSHTRPGSKCVIGAVATCKAQIGQSTSQPSRNELMPLTSAPVTQFKAPTAAVPVSTSQKRERREKRGG